MLKFLPYVVQALFVIAGLSLGLWLKAGASSGAHAAPAAAEQLAESAHAAEPQAKSADAAKPAKKKAAASKKKGGHGGEGGAEESPYGYLKFSRQFVVPVVGAAGVKSLVVMDINIEVPPDATEGAYTREPKLRDSLLGALLSLSSRGAFSETILEDGNLDVVRGELLQAARRVIGDDALNVLILSMARQDV